MSKQEQDAAIGRLVSELSEAKKTRAALVQEMRELSRSFFLLAEVFGSPESYKDFDDGSEQRSPAFKTIQARPGYRSAEDVSRLIDDLIKTSQEIRRIRKDLADAGVQVR
jgi:hypothetical protein